MTVSELFLKACVCDTQENFFKYYSAIEALENLDNLDGQGSRLVPYYLSKLSKYKLSSKHQKRFGVLKKYFWLKSIFLQNELIKICDNLAKHNIKPFVFKGMSVFNYYNNFTFRPTLDLDILVPYNSVKTCLDILKQEDYIFSKNYYFLLKYLPRLNYRHGDHAMFLYHKKNKVELDLHYNLNHLVSEETQELFLAEAQPHPSVKNALIPKLEHEVYISIIHGVLTKTHINWIMDVVMIKQVNKIINWEEILLIAKKEKKINVLKDGIKTLETFGVVFNAKIILSLQSLNSVSRIQKINIQVENSQKNNFFFLHKYLRIKQEIELRYDDVSSFKRIYLYIRVFLFLFFKRYFISKDIGKVMNEKKQLLKVREK